MKRILLAATVAALVAAGCSIREKPVLQLNDIAIASSTDVSVGQRIEAALTGRHWQIVDREPGAYVARFSKPDGEGGVISATIRVSYDADSYSIAYVDSENLLYDAETGTIHRNYNRWVANLETDLAAAM